MNRRNALLLLAALPVAAASQAQSLTDLAGAMKDPLISSLTSKLGVTDSQAKGGMGSLLTLAKEKMGGGDFGKLTALMPQASKYMDTAKQLGAVAGPLVNKKGLDGALSKLGMKPETVSKFVPTVTDYIGKLGGDSAKSMLTNALK
jgi:Protein of unknown function VcgC/VcgE (DUF2780)